MNKLVKYLGKRKDAVIRRELARAHLMIVLLALVIVVWLTAGKGEVITLDPILSAAAAILLVLVIAISATTSFVLFSRRK